MNRFEKKGDYYTLILPENKKQKIKGGLVARFDKQDMDKIKPHKWFPYKYGKNIVAAAIIKRKIVIMTKHLFDEIDRVHRANGDFLDIRRKNIKYFNDHKNLKKSEENKNELVKEESETKMVVVDSNNYNTLEKIKKEEGFKDQNDTISVLIHEHNKMNEPVENCSCEDCSCDKISFWDKLRARFHMS